MIIEVPIRIESVANIREHWTTRARRAGKHKADVHIALRHARAPFALPCVVTLTRVAPRVLDGDNLQSGLKAARDGVALWLDADDADPRITWRYAQVQGKPKEYGLLIDIAPAALTAPVGETEGATV